MILPTQTSNTEVNTIINTSYHWLLISTNKEINQADVSSLIITNTGETPFSIAGQTIERGKSFKLPADGTISDFNERLTFLETGRGSKSAVLEYKTLT